MNPRAPKTGRIDRASSPTPNGTRTNSVARWDSNRRRPYSAPGWPRSDRPIDPNYLGSGNQLLPFFAER